MPNHVPTAPPTRPAYPFSYGEATRTLAPVSAASQVPMMGSGPTVASTPRPGGKSDGGLDGISALLQADKIVDRHLG